MRLRVCAGLLLLASACPSSEEVRAPERVTMDAGRDIEHDASSGPRDVARLDASPSPSPASQDLQDAAAASDISTGGYGEWEGDFPKLDGGPCAMPVDLSAPVLSSGFAFGTTNKRNARSPIDSSNVAKLRLAFGYAALGDRRERRGAPAVTARVVYFSAGTEVKAIDRKTGCQYWSFQAKDIVRSSSISYLNEGGGKPALVLFGDLVGNVYAVDASSGKQRWTLFAGTDPSFHMITGGLQVHRGLVFVPVASKEVLSVVLNFLLPCCSSHGMVHAIDAYTGEVAWTWHATPNAQLQSSGKLGPSGVSIWGTPAIDEARGLLYVPTGQNYTRPTTETSDAIVALDLASGTVRWIFQGTAQDAWNAACNVTAPLDSGCDRPEGQDLDFGAPPILARTRSGREVVIAGAKSGIVYALDPDSGSELWRKKIGAGGALGGVHWGMAVDAQHVFVGISDVHVNKAPDLLNTDIAKNMDLVAGAKPGVYALDLATGDVGWEVHPKHEREGKVADSIFSAALSVTNDVVFAGSLDGTLHALRASDGSTLWTYDTTRPFTGLNGSSGSGGTIDSVGAVIASGDVLVNSGYDTFGGVNVWQAGPGNALLVFRLPR
jgi:polyvinyl alcohol dehydrogenase (cytochrome)